MVVRTNISRAGQGTVQLKRVTGSESSTFPSSSILVLVILFSSFKKLKITRGPVQVGEWGPGPPEHRAAHLHQVLAGNATALLKPKSPMVEFMHIQGGVQ